MVDARPDSNAIPEPLLVPMAPVFSGPRARWTEIILRQRDLRHTVFNLLKALVLIYVFLVAIKMMGHGVKITGTNPDYVKTFPDPAFGTARDEVGPLLVHPDYFAGRGVKLDGRKVGTIGEIISGGDSAPGVGYVAVEDRALKAILADGLPKWKTHAAHKTPVWIRGTRGDAVVVEPIPGHGDWLYTLFNYASNPFLALLIGILITAVFQSSSFTTSFTVGLVAAVDFPLEYAIPIVMGANIGTSVTNIAVSMGYISRRNEFERAFAGATVHDFFNVLTVVVLFALEQATGVLRILAGKMAGLVYSGGASIEGKPTNIISVIVGPVIKGLHALLADVFGLSQNAMGITMTVIGVVLLFTALLLLVKVLQQLVLKRAESFFDRVLFRNAGTAFIVGLVLTASVQSSSVTTSLVVPLIAAGMLTLNQVFPYLLGANIGTTVTALLAAFATSAQTEAQAKVGLTLACAHLLFNVIGAIIFYPLRWMPIAMARGLARRAAKSRYYAVLFVVGIFFGIPLIGIAAHALFRRVFGG